MLVSGRVGSLKFLMEIGSNLHIFFCFSWLRPWFVWPFRRSPGAWAFAFHCQSGIPRILLSIRPHPPPKNNDVSPQILQTVIYGRVYPNYTTVSCIVVHPFLYRFELPGGFLVIPSSCSHESIRVWDFGSRIALDHYSTQKPDPMGSTGIWKPAWKTIKIQLNVGKGSIHGNMSTYLLDRCILPILIYPKKSSVQM